MRDHARKRHRPERSERHRRTLERFFVYVRLVSQAVAAGVERKEAERRIYPDVYENDAYWSTQR